VSNRTDEPAADIDPIIHVPARLAIMAVLLVGEGADFMFVQKQTGLTRGNLSSHLMKLEAAGYVVSEKTFVRRVPRTLLRLTDAGRDALRRYRLRMEEALRALPK
jgi:DNA-binding transcriptional ArsR family regulator